MKGCRNAMPSRMSGISGEPILRPFSGMSRLSRTRTASPTFDLNMSSYDPTPINHEINELAYTTVSMFNAESSIFLFHFIFRRLPPNQIKMIIQCRQFQEHKSQLCFHRRKVKLVFSQLKL